MLPSAGVCSSKVVLTNTLGFTHTLEAGTEVATAQVAEVVDAEGEETRCTSGVKMVVSGDGKMNGKWRSLLR